MKGRKDHEHGKPAMHPHHHPVAGHHRRARGGKVPEIGGLPEIGGKPEKPEDKPALSGKKHGGKVRGKHPGHRLDKRARGGPVGKGKSPFSGADGPNLSYAHADIPNDAHAAGRDKT